MHSCLAGKAESRHSDLTAGGISHNQPLPRRDLPRGVAGELSQNWNGRGVYLRVSVYLRGYLLNGVLTADCVLKPELPVLIRQPNLRHVAEPGDCVLAR